MKIFHPPWSQRLALLNVIVVIVVLIAFVLFLQGQQEASSEDVLEEVRTELSGFKSLFWCVFLEGPDGQIGTYPEYNIELLTDCAIANSTTVEVRVPSEDT